MSDSPAAQKAPAVFTARHWRALALLTALVLTAHWAALRGAALQWGTADEPALPAPALETRTIAQAPLAAPPAPVKRPAIVQPQKPEKLPKSVPNRPPAEEIRARSATEIIANPELMPAPEMAPQNAASASAPETAPAVPGVATAAAEAAAQAASLPAPPMLSGMALPGSMQLSYKMTGSAEGLTYYASAQLDWNNTGTSYDSSMTVSALFLGSRSMASRGEIGANGLAPVRFADKTRKRELAAHFERERQQIVFSNNAPSAPWMPGAQDRLSVFMQLAGMLAGNPAAFPPGSTISVYTAGPRAAETMNFLVEAEESIELPAGGMTAIKLASQVRNDYDRRLEIWYAPSLGFLPVRVKYTLANNDFIDQQLKAVKKL